MKRLDLHPFPTEQMNRLTPGKMYDIDMVYDRLRTLGTIKVDDIDFFKTMIDMEDGFSVSDNYVIRTDTASMESTEDDIPSTYTIDPDLDLCRF